VKPDWFFFFNDSFWFLLPFPSGAKAPSLFGSAYVRAEARTLH
jgi:hypothetical protein